MTGIALLRGINVGGKNKLPMADLARLFGSLGCSQVRTYIQSGNVVFEAADGLEGDLEAAVSAQILKDFGLEVPVVMRTAADLAQVVAGNPFLRAGPARTTDPEALHVAFLSAIPSRDRLATLDPDGIFQGVVRAPISQRKSAGDVCRRSHRTPDSFIVERGEIFLNCPNGLARTKLTNDYFDRRLGVVSTFRNWRTVLKLLEMSKG